jgi:hypothetical protein
MPRIPSKVPLAPPQDQEQGGDWIYRGGSKSEAREEEEHP